MTSENMGSLVLIFFHMTMQLMFKYILEITCFFMFPKDLTLHLEDIDLIPCEIM